MEIQIKKAVKAGNSSAVIVPRAWLNQKVRVELIKKTNSEILVDILNIIKEYIELKEIIGIYLVGSYARQEETENSDIDILVITENTDKEIINNGIYSILIVSELLLMQKLENNLFPIGQMLKEAKPLINSKLLESIDVKATKKNTEWYIRTTKDKLDIIKKYLDKAKGKLSDKIAYTLILRLRTLYIIEKLIKNKDYSGADFLKLIKKLNSIKSYEAYLRSKSNQKDKYDLRVDEARVLYDYLMNYLKKVKMLF